MCVKLVNIANGKHWAFGHVCTHVTVAFFQQENNSDFIKQEPEKFFFFNAVSSSIRLCIQAQQYSKLNANVCMLIEF